MSDDAASLVEAHLASNSPFPPGSFRLSPLHRWDSERFRFVMAEQKGAMHAAQLPFVVEGDTVLGSGFDVFAHVVRREGLLGSDAPLGRIASLFFLLVRPDVLENEGDATADSGGSRFIFAGTDKGDGRERRFEVSFTAEAVAAQVEVA